MSKIEKNSIIDKPWGSEEIIYISDKYCVKKLILHKGEMCSYQYHNIKTETITVLEGIMKLQIENDYIDLNPGNSYTILPKQKHRMIATDNNVIYIESSSPELDDVVRLEDKYSRK
tara:strand:+ start:235 stop:582 length:348 start_codon:yes stop_codon:yes gene_type:complete